MGSILTQPFLFMFSKLFTVYKGFQPSPGDIARRGVLFSQVGDTEVNVAVSQLWLEKNFQTRSGSERSGFIKNRKQR